jgi:hypothetical protein
LALGCFNRHGKSTRTTTCSRRIQRRTPGAATTAHGGGRRAAAQVQRTCKGATKHRDVHKAHQGAPHLHAVRLVGSRRRRGSKRRPARVCAATALKLRVWDERGGATGGWRPLNRPGTVARRAGHGAGGARLGLERRARLELDPGSVGEAGGMTGGSRPSAAARGGEGETGHAEPIRKLGRGAGGLRCWRAGLR